MSTYGSALFPRFSRLLAALECIPEMLLTVFTCCCRFVVSEGSQGSSQHSCIIERPCQWRTHGEAGQHEIACSSGLIAVSVAV